MSVYLDFNATTAIDPEVLGAMMPYLTDHFGNPSSIHQDGRTARTAIDSARQQVADLVAVEPAQIVFTSGGTEANNIALKGCATRGILFHSAIEHASVIEPATALEKQGWQRRVISVDSSGVVDYQRLHQELKAYAQNDKALNTDLQIVSVMLANNETGVIQDVRRIGDMAHEFGAIMHSDAVQAAGKIAVDFSQLDVDMLTLSAHKIYGPKGVGALVVGKAIDLQSLTQGGGHEKGLRAGTENLAGIVGFGAAAQLAKAELEQRQAHMQGLQRSLEKKLAQIPGVQVFSNRVLRLPNTTQMSVPGIAGETLLMQLDKRGIAVSSGSACSSTHTEPSHVLSAMGVSKSTARGAIRLSVGKDSTEQEMGMFITALKEILKIN